MNFSFEMSTVASKLTPIFLDLLRVLETRFRENSSSPRPLVGELTWVKVPMTFSSFSEETENLGNHLPDINIQGNQFLLLIFFFFPINPVFAGNIDLFHLRRLSS